MVMCGRNGIVVIRFGLAQSGVTRILDAMGGRGVRVEQVIWATIRPSTGIQVGMFWWGYRCSVDDDIAATVELVKVPPPDIHLTTWPIP